MPITTTVESMPKWNGTKFISADMYTAPIKIDKRKQRVRNDKPNKFRDHIFQCFDGEGYEVNGRHEYVYLCAYNGETYSAVRNDDGLGSTECFRFLINQKRHNPNAINIIFGGSYDANMMMRDLMPSNLNEIRQRGYTNWDGFRIEYVPWKYFQVTHVASKVSIRLWDVIGFFQMSFVAAIDGWLGIKSSVINKGKAKRSKFTADDIENIIPYCQEELKYLEQLAQRLWECLDGVGIKIRRWDGAGAIAQQLLTEYGIYNFKGTKEQQDKYYYYARCAYAGGRFENFMPGDFEQPVYGYDINSAYPYAIAQLPEFKGLKKCRKRNHSNCTIGEYDLLHLHYEGDLTYPIHPYYHRGEHLEICYPANHKGWHWAPEYLVAKGAPNSITVIDEHYIYIDNGHRPFAWVADKYNERLEMKKNGDPREKVIKLGLNSLYGKLAQQKGWKEGNPIPRFHQLYWAGWVTAKCRSMVYSAMMQAPFDIIAVETDGIITRMPLKLKVGTGLGEWEYKQYEWITYVQSGLYWAGLNGDIVKLRSRGINAKAITRDSILRGWLKYSQNRMDLSYAYVTTTTKRFHTISSCLATGNMDLWRQWKTQKKKVALIPLTTGKRAHNLFLCIREGEGSWGCRGWGKGKYHTTVARHLSNEESAPYAVLWDEDSSEMLEEFYLARHMTDEEGIINE